jgi:hypothetical protein
MTTATAARFSSSEHDTRGCLNRVARLDAAEDQVRALPTGDGGERTGDRQRVSVVDALGVDPDGTVGAHREAAPERLGSLLVADGDHDDLAAGVGIGVAACVAGGERLLDPERLLHGCDVPLVDCPLEVVRFDVTLVVGELDLVADDGNLLDTHDGFHRITPRSPAGRPGATERATRRAAAAGRSCGISTAGG